MQVRVIGRRPYAGIEEEMRAFSSARSAGTEDQLWIVEHDPVYTLGLAGRTQHLIAPGEIPVVQTQRGGQVTYHGPGQVVAYPLIDLKRLRIYVKEYVYRLEQAVLQVLAGYGLSGHRVGGAPGIYVPLADPAGHARRPADAGFEGLGKIAALGIKVSNHRSWHGLALNVAMDLEPFSRIDPCGYRGLQTVDLRGCGVATSWDDAAGRLAERLKVMLAP